MTSIDLDHCPTCGQEWEREGPCDAIKPDTAHDVLPIRCVLPAKHRSGDHWAPPLWPNTPPVQWFDHE